jgi:hypothetical protein
MSTVILSILGNNNPYSFKKKQDLRIKFRGLVVKLPIVVRIGSPGVA